MTEPKTFPARMNGERIEVDLGEWPIMEWPCEIDVVIRRHGSDKTYKTIRFEAKSVTYA